jgi:hypothetical protein
MDKLKLPDSLPVVYPFFFKNLRHLAMPTALEDISSIFPEISFIFVLRIKNSRSHVLPVTTIPLNTNKRDMGSK